MVLSIPFGSCDSRMILRFPAHKCSNDVLLMISIFLSNYYYRIVSYKSVSCVQVGTVPDIVVEPKYNWESIYIVVYILFVCMKFKKELFRWILKSSKTPKGLKVPTYMVIKKNLIPSFCTRELQGTSKLLL